MHDPSLQPNLELFFDQVREAPARALLLDYDGTIAPFDRLPHSALPYRGVRELLDDIMAQSRSRVVIVTGRWSIDLLPVLDLARTPEVWASHGWERLMPGGDYTIDPMPVEASKVLADAHAWAAELEALGARRELKPGSLALHWRGLSAAAVGAIRRQALEAWISRQLHTALIWEDFDGGIELRVPGRDKGHVVDTVLAETGPRAAAAYLGDDLADESAFRAMQGRGISVLVRPTFRQTFADAWIQPPDGLLMFLDRWRSSGAFREAAS